MMEQVSLLFKRLCGFWRLSFTTKLILVVLDALIWVDIKNKSINSVINSHENFFAALRHHLFLFVILETVSEIGIILARILTLLLSLLGQNSL